MSMLAERKRKQKWSLNPRGKFWADDSNKFGQKLLEKMGWVPGKGLGLKEDGMTDHVKVAYKNDSEGMGYKKNDNQWTEHETNFSSLLETLAGTETSQDNTVKINSLEEQSKSSKARLHYRKFTRGKDLSNYSKKDLASIFGKKSLNESPNQHIEEEEVNEDLLTDNNFSYGGSMSDYFKKKLPSFGKSNGYKIGSNGVLKASGFEKNELESESETTVGFGFKQEQTSIESNEEAISKKKKNKKKRSLEDNSDLNDTLFKKKKTQSKKKESETGLSNLAFDPLFSPVKVQKHILEPIEESTAEMLNDTVGEVAENFKVQVQINNDVTPVENQLKISEDNTLKKRKKNKNKMKNLDDLKQGEQCEKKKIKKKKLEDGVDENMDIVVELEVKTGKKNRKKKHEDVINKDLQPIESSVIELTPQKLKTSKKAFEGTENYIFSIGTENESTMTETENPYELKPKRKKKNKPKEESPGLINPLFDMADTANDKDLMNDLYEVKRNDKIKKKKKQQESKENGGIDNPALALDASIDEECDLMLNIASTPVITTPKITEQSSIHKIKPLSRRKSVRFSDVTRERIIPSKEDIESETLEESREIIEIEGILNDSSELSYIDKFIQKKKAKKCNKGIENSAFDQQANNIEENITSMSKTIDTFQAEVENDINEAKIKSIEVEDIMVGEVGNPEGENEKLKDGTVKLRFKHANFKGVYRYMESLTGAKKSYKHLIKGDIVIGFRDTNLHQIEGYAVQKIS